MDALTALVLTAERRLALRRLLMAIVNPKILDGSMAPLKIKLPIELAGLKGRMLLAEAQERKIGALGARYDKVQANIGELIDAHAEHAGALEHYEGDLRRKIESMIVSNGGDPLDGTAGQPGQSGDQVISSETPKPGEGS